MLGEPIEWIVKFRDMLSNARFVKFLKHNTHYTNAEGFIEEIRKRYDNYTFDLF